jgi:hypothetical protein
MKKLLLLSVSLLIASNILSQVSTPKCQSYSEDKQLAKYMFDKINQYRNSLGELSYIWSEPQYQTSIKWNNYLSENALYGHRNGPEWIDMGGSELIGGVTLSDSVYNIIDSDLYEYVADSMVMQWIHSANHHPMLKAPRRTETKPYARLDLNEDGHIENFDVSLMKYGAISVNINRYEHYTIVQCIFHLMDVIE